VPNALFDLAARRWQQRRLLFVFPSHHSPQLMPYKETVLRRRTAWWVPDCDGVLKFHLSIINRLIQNRLLIIEKIESSILTVKLFEILTLKL